MTLGRKSENVAAQSYHGGLDPIELANFGITPSDAIDFSSNILPQGPSPLVRDAISKADLKSYPDRDCYDLRCTLAQLHRIDPNRLIVGNGCSELIHLVANSLLQPMDEVIVVGPTFSEYQRASRLASAIVTECRAEADSDFCVPIEKVDELLETKRFKMLWICNPNNPTGQVTSSEYLVRWIDHHPQVIFVVDESYIEFCDNVRSLLELDRENLIVLRSMTKAYALAGVRLGFACLPLDLGAELKERRVPWNVSVVAQIAGIAAAKDRTYYATALKKLREAKSVLTSRLHDYGFKTVPSETGFFLLNVDNAPAIRHHLLSLGLVVRDCSSFGIENYLRIAVQDLGSNARLLTALTNATHSFLAKVTPANHLASENRCDSVEDIRFTEDIALPAFPNANFLRLLNQLFLLRRDVRRFRCDPLPVGLLGRCIESACLAPSVGLSQPWRFVTVKSPERRAKVIAEFESQNLVAAAGYKDPDLSKKYSALKLAGLREAPEHLAVFVEPDPLSGHGLGRATMPESVTYSVVAAIQNLWLAARAEGVGVGWVSILRPERIKTILEIPQDWRLVAYLCIGWPQVESDDIPELQHRGWEHRVETKTHWFER